MSKTTGPAIDLDTACIACGSQSSPEPTVICGSCQQGFHLACFRLSSIPEEEEWVCQGCSQLSLLSVGQHVVLEMAQAMFTDDEDPHLTQGLFKGSITMLGDIGMGMLPPRREVPLLVEDAPIPNSLMFYSRASLKRLSRVPKESLQLAEQLYQRTTSQLTTVILSSSRWGMFGVPAAAAGRASEAWVSGQDAVQQAVQALQQPPKQLYLLKSSSRPAAGSTRSSRVNAGQQQGYPQGSHTEYQAQQPEQLSHQQSQLLQPIQPQQHKPELMRARPLQQQPQEQPNRQYSPAPASSWPPSTQQQLPCNMLSMRNGPQPATVQPAAQAAMQSQMTSGTAAGAYQPLMHTGTPLEQHNPFSHPAYPPWQPSYPHPYYGYAPVPACPWGWPQQVMLQDGVIPLPCRPINSHQQQRHQTGFNPSQQLQQRLLCPATKMLEGCSNSRREMAEHLTDSSL